MTIQVPGPITTGSSISVSNEVLWSTDARADLDPNTTDDQATALQDFLDLVGTSTARKDRVGYLIPGEYRSSVGLSIDNSNGHKPFRLYGAGGKVAQDAGTVIRLTADGGAGTYALDITDNDAVFEIENISFYGSGSPAAMGSVPWNMRALKIPSRCTVRGVSATGFFAGVTCLGDHVLIEDCTFQGNGYGFEEGPNSPTQGDIIVRRTQLGSSSRAAIGVARSSPLAGAKFHECELSTSPFCIFRYDDGTGATLQNWIVGVEIYGAATEFTGNGIVYDDIGDAAGISGMIFDHGAVNYQLYSDHIWVAKTPVAAWYNSGAINNVRFVNAFPDSTQVGGSGSYLPGMKAASLSEVTFHSGTGYPAALVAGGRPFETTGTNGSTVSKSHIGTGSGLGAIRLLPYKMSGSVSRGELLTNNNEYDVKKYAGTGRVVAVAGHDATNLTICHGFKSGIDSSLLVKNTSGSTLNKGLVKPHTDGGVQPVGTLTAGEQVIGRMLADGTADDALGVIELFI